MSGEADVVVVGAGAFGASTAFHLAKLGRRVILLDKAGCVTQTSSRAAGMIQQIQGDDELARMAVRSVRMLGDFEGLTGQPLTVNQWGSIKAARSEADEDLLRNEIDRGLLGGYEPDPLEVDPPGDAFDMADLPLDTRPLTSKMAEVTATVPGLAGVGISEIRGGLPTMTPDGHFIVDRIGDFPSVFVLTGCNVGGLCISPALGHDLAEWMVTGTAPPDIEPFQLLRFGAAYEAEDALRAACRARYTHKFSPEEVAGTGRA